MDKQILKDYENIKREYEDTERRIRKTEEELKKFDSNYIVQDSVKGGMGGTQIFKIEGVPVPEYERKRSLLMSRKLRLETLRAKLDVQLDEVEQYIDTIEDSRKRLILKFRFVDGMRWRDVAKALGPGNDEDSVRIEITRFLDKT